MTLSNASRFSDKAKPFVVSSEIARGLEEYLRSTSGHFPIYHGDRIVGVFVGVDLFNLLLHLAEALDDQRLTAALSREPSKEEGERHLSFEEVFS